MSHADNVQHLFIYLFIFIIFEEVPVAAAAEHLLQGQEVLH